LNEVTLTSHLVHIKLLQILIKNIL
jgi:hypothetical protein